MFAFDLKQTQQYMSYLKRFSLPELTENFVSFELGNHYSISKHPAPISHTQKNEALDPTGP